jgi:hypothetical protein
MKRLVPSSTAETSLLLQVRHLDAQQGYRLQLWNGLNATLYRLDSPPAREIAAACSKRVNGSYLLEESHQRDYITLVVEVADAKIAIVYLEGFMPDLLNKRGQSDLFVPTHALVYEGVRHYCDDVANVLEKAVINKIKPSLSALLF